MSLKLSIIIPCFNCAETVEESVASCYVQGFKNDEFEIVMVNDGSTDTTKIVLDTLAQKHPEIRLYSHEVNKGGGATRNIAASHARSNVLFCLDSDDILPANTLSKMLAFMEEKKSDAVGIHHSIKFRGKDIHDVEIVHTFGYAGEKIPFISLLQIDDVYSPLYSTFMITKDAFMKSGGYPESHGFDTQGLAWRFMAHGFTAYTCPDATYLHRTQFKQSYYLREATAGKINYNWQDIFIEHLSLFEDETQKFILNYNCKDFTRNIYEELRKREHVFKKDYQELVGENFTSPNVVRPERSYITRNSPQGIILRIKERARKNSIIRPTALQTYAFAKRIQFLLTEGQARKDYYTQIEKIKKDKIIVIDLSFGGIGDCLAWSTLPELLSKKYGVEFYISPKTRDVIRHKDTFKLCFEMNPYFKGVKEGTQVFKMKFFEREKSFYTFLTDKEGKTVIETLEKQFDVEGKGIPHMYYKPNTLKEYSNIVLIDEQTISGKRFGWKFKENAFLNEAKKYCGQQDKIEYVEQKKQDFFTYIDMIYSCKHFVVTFSGGASIAACFPKPFSVIWPYDAVNGSNFQYRYAKSAGKYVL